MGETVKFETELSPEDVVATLSRAFEESRERGGIKPRLVGSIQDARVSIHRHRPYTRNMPVLSFHGSVAARGSGAMLEGRYEYEGLFGPVFVAFGYLMAVAGLVGMAKGAWVSDVELFLFSALAFAGGLGVAYLTPRLANSFARDESDLLGQHIRDLLSGRSV